VSANLQILQNVYCYLLTTSYLLTIMSL